MPITRDTSADDAAEAMRQVNAAARLETSGELDPPLTLTGSQARVLDEAIREATDVLQRLEATTREYRLKGRITGARVKLGHAYGYVKRG